jgi:leucine-zipper-like transcriptional regulator 1
MQEKQSVTCEWQKTTRVQHYQSRIFSLFLTLLFITAFNFAYASGVGEIWNQATRGAAGWGHRLNPASVVFNNEMWVLGGTEIDSGQHEYDRNDAWYSTDGTTWTRATSNAGWKVNDESGNRYRAVVYNKKIWVMNGAYDGGRNIWNSSNGSSWSQVIPWTVWSDRSGFALVVFNNKMYVLGGYDQGGDSGKAQYMNDVWSSSDGVNWKQETANAGWPARSNFSSFVYNNKIWITCGYNGKNYNNVAGDVWYSTDGKSWTQATSAAFKARADCQAEVWDNKMWVFGGHGGSGGYDEIHDAWFSSDGSYWQKARIAVNWDARDRFTSLVYKNKLWLMGGFNSQYYSGWRADVWYSDSFIWNP